MLQLYSSSIWACCDKIIILSETYWVLSGIDCWVRHRQSDPTWRVRLWDGVFRLTVKVYLKNSGDLHLSMKEGYQPLWRLSPRTKTMVSLERWREINSSGPVSSWGSSSAGSRIWHLVDVSISGCKAVPRANSMKNLAIGMRIILHCSWACRPLDVFLVA